MVEFAPDEDAVYTAWKQIVLRAFDGSVKKLYSTQKKPVEALSVSPSGRFIAGALPKGKILIFEKGGNEPLRQLEHPTSHVASIRFISDYEIVSAGWDGNLIVWDLILHKKAWTLASESMIFSMETYAGGTRAITGHKTLSARTWDLEAEGVPDVHGHEGTITGLIRTSKDRMATSSKDGSAAVWNLYTGERQATMIAKTGEEALLGIGMNDGALLAVSRKRIFSIELDKISVQREYNAWAHTLDMPQHNIKNARVLSPQNGVIALRTKKAITAWRPGRWPRGRRFAFDVPISDGPFISLDGRFVVVLLEYGRGGMAVIDLETRKAKNIKLKGRPTDRGDRGWPWQMSLDTNKQYVALGYFGGSVEVRDLWDGSIVHSFEGAHRNSVNTLSFYDDGERLCSASHDGMLIVWDLKKEAPIHTYGGDTGWSHCAICDNPDTIVAADLDGGLHFLRIH